MNPEEPSDLVKIRVDLPSGSHVDAEGLWSRPLGMGLYEIRSPPLLAYDLHLGDVVSCTEGQDARPQMLRVVCRSGHRTLRILFSEGALARGKGETLRDLSGLGASHWPGWQRFYAVDVPPASDYEAVCYYLWEREQVGMLQYETGMTRPYTELLTA